MTWSTYTVVVLGFRIQPGQDSSTITKALDEAAVKLLAAYPFLSGQVIIEGRTKTNSGTYKIVPYPPHSDGKTPVRPKDCTQIHPSYDEILKADAPFSMLESNVLCPAKGFGYLYEEKAEMPVLFIQANFVRGGLLLCFASMHNALDMNGQGIMIRQFAKLMRGEQLDPELVAVGNQDADSIVPFLKDGERPLEHGEMLGPSLLGLSGVVPPPPGLRWVYWCFPADKLASLKKLASLDTGKRASTNDAITAFYTQRLTVMRIAAGRLSREGPLNCLRAADMRKRLNPPVPTGYLGHFVGLAYRAWPKASAVADSPLSTTTQELRATLNTVDDHYVRSLATLVRTTEDKSTIFYGAKKQNGIDIFISSWAQIDLAQTTSFGPVLGGPNASGQHDGRPDFMRRAKMDLVPDLTYIMPKNKAGDMHIGACLFEADIEGLEGDDVWREYTRLVG
jgi:trichothecene 3-O-acetyltransferase